MTERLSTQRTKGKKRKARSGGESRRSCRRAPGEECRLPGCLRGALRERGRQVRSQDGFSRLQAAHLCPA